MITIRCTYVVVPAREASRPGMRIMLSVVLGGPTRPVYVRDVGPAGLGPQ
jgi:hypothetical protein